MGDTKARTICISLINEGELFSLDGIVMAAIKGIKPDGKLFYNSCTIVGNEVQYNVTNQTNNVEGDVICELHLFDGDNNVITSPEFTIKVYATLFNDDIVESQNEYSGIPAAIAECMKQRIACDEDAANAKLYLEAVKEVKENINESQKVVEECREYCEHAAIMSESQKTAAESATKAKTYMEYASLYKENAAEYAEEAKQYTDRAQGAISESKAYMEQMETVGQNQLKKLQEAIADNLPNFQIDIETGHLMYQGGRFNFQVNNSGHLEWEVAV